MLDRESTFAQPEIVELLKTRFVPVAIDQAYHRRQQDTEGEFYRKIAGQGPRSNFESTTQGFYIATPSGELLLYNNNRDPEKVLRLMRQRLREFDQSGARSSEVAAIEAAKVDARYNVQPPEGGLVVRVHAKVLGGYTESDDPWQRIFQTAVSRDNLWITRDEHQALVQGQVPRSLQVRIARFHLVDNTRGEPPMWSEDEIRTLEMSLRDGQLEGRVALSTRNGDRGYEATMQGRVEVNEGRVVGFDLVSLGQFRGEGPFTRNAPPGRFPLGISFTLADGSDIADRVPPQGSRGWLPGYLR
ncbi:MAG: hypothetical protein J5I93_05235 [Pirellulaceae bacterium]|nr:hypothetical protein [Pirellulaceae bacterium]